MLVYSISCFVRQYQFSHEKAKANSRFIAGVNTTWIEEVNWNSVTSLKMGLEIGQGYPNRYGSRFMFEVYKGLIPFGQIYTSDTEYYGLGMYVDFN